MDIKHSVMQHLLEIRFEKHLFNFMDYRGELVDFLIKQYKFENIKINRDRIDVATDDFSFFIFLSNANFGLQIDGSLSFNQFKNKTQKLFEWIKEFGKYKMGEVKRIGVKTSSLSYPWASNQEKLLDIFMSQNKANSIFEKETESKIDNSALVLRNCRKESSSFHVFSTILPTEEAITRYFGNKINIYKDLYQKSFGMYTEVDYFQSNEDNPEILKDINLKEVKDLCLQNVREIDEINTTFLKSYYV